MRDIEKRLTEWEILKGVFEQVKITYFTIKPAYFLLQLYFTQVVCWFFCKIAINIS